RRVTEELHVAVDTERAPPPRGQTDQQQHAAPCDGPAGGRQGGGSGPGQTCRICRPVDRCPPREAHCRLTTSLRVVELLGRRVLAEPLVIDLRVLRIPRACPHLGHRGVQPQPPLEVPGSQKNAVVLRRTQQPGKYLHVVLALGSLVL